MSKESPKDWTRPAALALPKEGYFQLEQGRYGPQFPQTPANYGFTVIAKVQPGQSVYKVKPGDTLSKIAQVQLGKTSRWTEIWEANKGRIADPNLIEIGWELVLPK